MRKNNFKKYLTVFIFFVALFSITKLFSQNAKIDSLRNVLKTAKEDTNKVKTLNTLSSVYSRMSNYYTSQKYAEEALSLSKKINFKIGEAKSHSLIGIMNERQGNYSKAMESYLASLKILEELNDKAGISSCYLNIGNVNKGQGKYSEALTNYSKSLKIKQAIGDKKGIANVQVCIGIVYKNQGKYPDAVSNYFAALKTYESIGDKYGVAQSYNNMGNIYILQEKFSEALINHKEALKIRIEIGDKEGIAGSYGNIGAIYQFQNNFTEAIKNHTESLKISEEIGDLEAVAITSSDIGSIYIMQKKYPEAIKELEHSLQISTELGDMEGIATSQINLGKVYNSLQKFLEAEEKLLLGLNTAKNIGHKQVIQEAYWELHRLDSLRGDMKNALINFKLFIAYKDSLLNEESNKQITQMKTLYETEKKDNEIVVLNKDKEIQAKEISKQKLVRNGFVGGFTIVLLFAGIFFTQRNRISEEKQRSEELLLNILPAEVADELKEKGSADAKLIDEVTVIFTDFKGFTSLSEKLSPQELVKDLNECFSAFDHIMEKYGIEKIKTIGDSYMAAGGLPTPNKTHAVDVIKAALEMRDFVAQGKARKLISGEPYFEIRIGIHTGPVVAGIVGIKKFAYDIWGDTVNTASRMESSGEVGKINISETTYELVKGQFTCEYRGEVEAKGKGNIKMYFVEKEYLKIT